MSVSDYLPSARFTTIVGSIALAGILVWGAYTITHAPVPTSSELASTQTNGTSSDWKKSLEDIQAQNSEARLPSPPNQESVNRLLGAATNENLTDTVGRTLLINLTTAKAQGLGSDIPTQDTLVADAASKITQDVRVSTYTQEDLSLTSNSQASFKAYGNAFMAAAARHPKVNYDVTLYIIGTSTGNNKPALLNQLKVIGAEYAALAKDLSNIEVPSTLAPLHLKVVNNFDQMAKTYPEMQALFSDPLRALGGLQLYDALTQETLGLFINIAQGLNQNGILFTKDEPGFGWSLLMP